MTCIIGLADKKSGKVFIGGDSAGVGSWGACQIRADVKVFRNGPFVFGFTTSYRMGQLLRYAFTPPEQSSRDDDMKFMVATFIPAVQSCLAHGGFEKVKESQKEGGEFLVGYRGQLFGVREDYQVGIVLDGIQSVGNGYEIALGAMYALPTLKPKERIKRALEIVTHLNVNVRPPFVILEC